jgi:hypothetical protein
MIPVGVIVLQSVRLNWLSLAVCLNRFSRVTLEMRLPNKLNMVSWEQQLRMGRMASSWESVTSQSSKSRLSRVSTTSLAELGGAQDSSLSKSSHVGAGT